MTCRRVQQGLAADIPLEELLEHVDACRDCQFYLENTVHARDLALTVPSILGKSLGASAAGMSCEEALKALSDEEFRIVPETARHLERCRPCRETAAAFAVFSEQARNVKMPPRLQHRLEGVTEERGISIFGRILPYVAAFLLSASLTLFFATKGNLSQEVVKLQEKVYQTKGTAVGTYGRIVGYLARNLDKEDKNHEMHESSGH